VSRSPSGEANTNCFNWNPEATCQLSAGSQPSSLAGGLVCCAAGVVLRSIPIKVDLGVNRQDDLQGHLLDALASSANCPAFLMDAQWDSRIGRSHRRRQIFAALASFTLLLIAFRSICTAGCAALLAADRHPRQLTAVPYIFFGASQLFRTEVRGSLQLAVQYPDVYITGAVRCAAMFEPYWTNSQRCRQLCC